MTFGSVGYTPGSGANMAMDNTNGRSYQRIKLVSGAEGSETETGTPTNPLSVASALPSTPAHTQPAVPNDASTTVLAANANRKAATIVNYTTATMWLKEGATAVMSEGFRLLPGQSYQVQSSAVINVIQTSGGALSLSVFEVV